MPQQYDLICLGGGSGGLAAAKRAAEYGAKVLVVEAKKLGGTCVNVGCVPKKITWHAAQIVDFSRLAKDYGFNTLEPSINYSAFVEKRDAFIHKLNGIYQNGLDKAGVTTIDGYAKFTDDKTITVNGKSYQGKHIIIAVGGEPMIPEIPGSELGMDSDDFFAMRELPQSIAIVGAGYIAIELACAMHALGVETHVIVRKDRFLKQVDDDIYRVLAEQIAKEGIHVHFESQIEHIHEDTSNQLKLLLNQGEQLVVDKLLWAIGRTPMTDAIGLKHTSIATQSNGNIIIDEYQNTTQAGVYAIGDITGQPTLTPAAIEAGRQLAERLFNQKNHAKADFTYVPTVIFTHPAIATVGLTESEACEKYGKENINIYRSTFNPLLRSMTDHKIPTVMKIVCANDNEHVVGLHLLGDFVDEVIQGFAVAVQMGATKSDLDKTLAIHPTSAEELVTMR